jgi:hypothetical protein
MVFLKKKLSILSGIVIPLIFEMMGIPLRKEIVTLIE